MTHQGGKHIIQNRLWLARKRRGLEQKQVAYLLAQQSTDQLSRYERGRNLPTLATALMLEIIYGSPIRLLYQELYEQLRAEIGERLESQPILNERYGALLNQAEEAEEYCAYAELLGVPNLSQPERDQVRRHITRLVRKLAYF